MDLATTILWIGILLLIVGSLTITTPVKIAFGPFGTFAGPALFVAGCILIVVYMALMGFIKKNDEITPIINAILHFT